MACLFCTKSEKQLNLRPKDRRKNGKHGRDHYDNRADRGKVSLEGAVDESTHQNITAGQFDQEVEHQRQADRIDDLGHQRDLEQADVQHDHKAGRDN